MENNIRKIRKEQGMSIHKLAEHAKVSEVYIYHLENGNRKNPSYEVMKNIAKSLNTSIEEIFL